MAPIQKRKQIRRARKAAIHVKVVKCNGSAYVKKIPLLCNRVGSIPLERSADTLEDWSHLGLSSLCNGRQPRPSQTTAADSAFDKEHLSSEYSARKRREESSWEAARDGLQRAFVAQQFLPHNKMCCACEVFKRPLKMAVCRCQDCGPEQHFCLDCATSLHNNRNHFHVLELWKVIHYIIAICIFYLCLSSYDNHQESTVKTGNLLSLHVPSCKMYRSKTVLLDKIINIQIQQ